MNFEQVRGRPDLYKDHTGGANPTREPRLNSSRARDYSAEEYERYDGSVGHDEEEEQLSVIPNR